MYIKDYKNKLENRYDLKVFTDNVEYECLEQVEQLLQQDVFKNSKIRLMADTHAGKGCVVGFTANLGDKVIPNVVGVDIGCGMLCVNLGNIDIDLKYIDDVINKTVPSGRESFQYTRTKFNKLNQLHCIKQLKDTDNFEKQIGTLGGGNHFIEIDVDDENNKYLVIHTGSRNLGKQVAEYYQNLAIELCSNKKQYEEQRQTIIDKYKNSGKQQEIQRVLKEYEQEFKNVLPKIPNELCYLTGEYRDMYLHDMKICQEYASLNRIIIAGNILNEILGKCSFTLVNETEIDIQKAKQYNVSTTIPYFETIHNYIDFDDNIVRKGAISAYDGEKVIIPINMRDGSIIAVGRGNEDYNYSAPHGAGRIMSRSKAKQNINLQDYIDTMKNIYSTSVCESTIDEAPFAYKPMDEIINNITDTVDVIKVIKPIYNFKASK